MMEGWREVRFEEITDLIKRGVAPKYVEEDGYIVINQKCIRDGVLSFNDSRLTSKEKKITDEKFVQIGDVLINSTGTGTLGRTAPVRELQGITTVDTHVTILRGNEKVDKLFLGYLASHYEPLITLLGKGATNQIELGASDLKVTKVVIPESKETQRKIATILSAYDDLIENNLKRIKLLDEKAQLTYAEWFVRMKFPGHETTPINKETGLPEGWEKKKIVNFNSLSQYKKKVTKFEDEIEYLATANVDGIAITERGEMFNWVNKPSRAQILPPKESVWFARMSNTYKVLHFTKQTNNNVLLSSGFAGFIPKNSNCLAFLFCMIKSEKFDLQKNMYASGSTQVSLNNQGLSLMNEIEPSLDLIEKFGEICLNNLEEIHVLYNQNQLLKEARDILLPRLMTGMIDVEQMKLENLQPTTA